MLFIIALIARLLGLEPGGLRPHQQADIFPWEVGGPLDWSLLAAAAVAIPWLLVSLFHRDRDR
jgi:hypothetical protein